MTAIEDAKERLIQTRAAAKIAERDLREARIAHEIAKDNMRNAARAEIDAGVLYAQAMKGARP